MIAAPFLDGCADDAFRRGEWFEPTKNIAFKDTYIRYPGYIGGRIKKNRMV